MSESPASDRAPASPLDRARAPHGAPDELRALASHRERAVREAVAANPATPRDAIDRLLDGLEEVDGLGERQALVAAVLGNPSLALWLLDDPGWLGRHGFDARLELARSPALTPLTWSALSRIDSRWVKGPLMASGAAPPDAWRRLGYPSELDALLDRASHQVHRPDAVAATLAALAVHPELPDKLRRSPAWLEQQRARVARLLARSPALTGALWRALHRHPDAGTRLSLLASPAAPPDAWGQLGFPDGGDWSLTGAHLDVDALEALAAAPPLAAITGLTLSQNELGEEAIAPLLRSPFLGGLVSLDLSRNELRDGGLTALARSPALPRLAHLSVAHCESLSDEGVRALLRAPLFARLASLRLDGCRGVSPEAREALRRAAAGQQGLRLEM